MANNTKRNSYSPEKKVSIIRLHLIEKTPISDICDKFKIHPTQYYRWQKEFFENGPLAFQKQQNVQQKKLKQKISSLEEKLNIKNEVVSEIIEENIRLKKSSGAI